MGIVTFWDNRGTQHLPINDYYGSSIFAKRDKALPDKLRYNLRSAIFAAPPVFLDTDLG
ncbi:hypothetical protein [Paraburkholderia sp. BL10I2N1]|uniref:hypothetical protein n=1 Tax=Paraburkholderia sp. BL10I2N1 TaxID=1938796 RepID=UPI00141505F6|nr:hypothetical protein [Paraburkholderia sp. BL10I2N1]